MNKHRKIFITSLDILEPRKLSPTNLKKSRLIKMNFIHINSYFLQISLI